MAGGLSARMTRTEANPSRLLLSRTESNADCSGATIWLFLILQPLLDLVILNRSLMTLRRLT
jgi:hypothetical protein